jgi:hypothetical protein
MMCQRCCQHPDGTALLGDEGMRKRRVLTAVITDAARPDGTSIGRKMVATGQSDVVELTLVVMVVLAAAGKETGVLDWACT